MSPVTFGGDPELAREVDTLCDRFAAALQRGESPAIEEFLNQLSSPRGRRVLLLELLSVELEVRRERGERVGRDEYRARFPAEQAAIDEAFAEQGAASTWTWGTGTQTADRPGDSPAVSCDEESLPRDFGDYQLQELLGKGGMGIVYRAHQRKVDRTVALKLLRPDRLQHMDSQTRRETWVRFRTEAHAAARIEHDNLLPVYDVGEVAGQPFFTMPHVVGESLAQRILRGPLEEREAARVVESSARAVQAAHQAGILHRDLKPHNILIRGEDQRPLVADFGLAKLCTESEQITLSGAVFGTPSYMAPEQAKDAGKASVASDVYSLGATLYHTLSGRPPFQAASVADILRQVCDGEPVSPRQLNPAISKDLETICLKCLEKEPHRRYDTAAALADDLERYREHRPILARPVGAAGRVAKWCRRRPAIAALVGALFLTVMGGVAGVSAALWRSETQRARAEHNLEVAELERNNARRAVDSLFVKLAEEDLLGIPGLEPVRQELLETALQFYKSFAQQHRNDVTAREDLLQILPRVSRIQLLLEDVEAARQSAESAIRLFEERAPRSHVTPSLLRHAELYHQLGFSEYYVGNLAAAERACLRAIELLEAEPQAEAALGPVRALRARTYLTLGQMLNDDGRFGDSLAAYQRAIDQAEGGRSITLGEILTEAAICQQSADDPEAAEQSLHRALQVLEGPAGQAPHARFLLLLAQKELAGVYASTGRSEQAVRVCERVAPDWQALTRAHPAVPQYARGYCQVLATSAGARLDLGDEAGAVADLDLASELSVSSSVVDTAWLDRDVLNFVGNLGLLSMAKRRLGKLEEAQDLLRQALALMDQFAGRRSYGPRVPWLYSTCLVNLADIEIRLRQLDDAKRHLADAMAIREQICAADPASGTGAYKLSIVYRGLGFLYEAAGDSDAMVHNLRKSVSVLEPFVVTGQLTPRALSDLAAVNTSLGIHFRQNGQIDTAAGFYEQSLRITEQLVADHPEVDRYRHELAKSACAARAVFLQRGDSARAERSVQRAVELWAALAKENPEETTYQRALGVAWGALASIQMDREDLAAAKVASQNACQIGEAVIQEQESGSTLASLAGCYLLRGKVLRAGGQERDEATSCYRRAVALTERAFNMDGRKYAGRYREACQVAAFWADEVGDWEDAADYWGRTARLEAGPDAETMSMLQALALARTQRNEEGRRACETLLEQGLAQPESFFHAARLFLVLSQRTEETLDAEADQQRTLELLDQAARAGFFQDEEARNWLREAEFDPLRDRPEFQKLLASVPQAAPKK